MGAKVIFVFLGLLCLSLAAPKNKTAPSHSNHSHMQTREIHAALNGTSTPNNSTIRVLRQTQGLGNHSKIHDCPHCDSTSRISRNVDLANNTHLENKTHSNHTRRSTIEVVTAPTLNITKREIGLNNQSECNCNIFLKTENLNHTQIKNLRVGKALNISCNLTAEESQKTCQNLCKDYLMSNLNQLNRDICQQYSNFNYTMDVETKACNASSWTPSHVTQNLCCLNSMEIDCSKHY